MSTRPKLQLGKPRQPAKGPGRIEFTPNWNEKIDEFDKMGLNPDLLHGIYSHSFRRPSEIQSLAIKPICDKRSVVVQAPPRTGKTCALAIGILNNIEVNCRVTQALVLAPTPEQAEYIYHCFGDIRGEIVIHCFTEDRDIDDVRTTASENQHIVIATPCMALDLIRNGYVRCNDIRMICVDDADQMLQGRFGEQLESIFDYIPPKSQALLFSRSSMSFFDFVGKFMRDPVMILVKEDRPIFERVRQFYVNVGTEERHKFETLLDICAQLSIQKAVVFANSKRTVDMLADRFEQHGFARSLIHADLTQAERDEVMRKFRIGETRWLIASDLLRRVVDVQQITLIINYKVPDRVEQFPFQFGGSCG